MAIHPSLDLDIIRSILIAHGIKEASLFGSFARQDARSASDVDLLIAPPEGLSLFGLVGIQLELEDALGRDVDLVTPGDLSPRILERAMKQKQSIL